MSIHNICYEQKYEKYQNFSSESFHFLVVKFSIYLNRRVFVLYTYMIKAMICMENKWCGGWKSKQ